MKPKKNSLMKFALPILLLIADAFFVYLSFFNPATTLLGKILFFAILELTLPTNLFLLSTATNGIENSIDIFFKSNKSKLLFALLFINFDFLVISITLSFAINLFYLLGLILPIAYFLVFAMLWKYFNEDSQKIKKNKTNKYLGVGVCGHYVFDGVDVLSEKNYTKTDVKDMFLINPFNPHFVFTSEQVLYVTGKSYKFYIATYDIDKTFTLIFLVRIKDALRFKLNTHRKEDFELNKNIFLAYCADKTENDDNFVYVENKLRYKIANSNSKTEKKKVTIEQKTELPHLTSQNKISNWFGDSFEFASQKEADTFVKFVVEQTKNGALDSEF